MSLKQSLSDTMDSILITGEDASSIALGLIAEKFKGQSQFPVEDLQMHWARLGLRLDDLVQGLTFLAREQKLTVDGHSKGAQLMLSANTLEEISGHGLSDLKEPLQNILRQAAERMDSSEDTGSADNERRDDFS